MRPFKFFSLLSILFTYLVIFIGGLVRVSGAGLGCPDWPKCFGRWIPPLHVSQLPAGFDPASFNFALAWIEYINRLIGMTLGIFIVITMILALVHFRHILRVWLPSVLAALLVAFQGWQGSRVVASELDPSTVTMHMVLAFIIISLLLYVYLQVHYMQFQASVGTARYPRGMDWAVLALWIFTITQVLLGTQVRGAIELAQRQFPLYRAVQWLDNAGALDDIHMMLGGMVTMGGWIIGIILLKYSKQAPLVFKQSTWAMMIILLLQITVGLILVLAGLPALMQLLHLWLASLLIGALLIQYTTLKQRERG